MTSRAQRLRSSELAAPDRIHAVCRLTPNTLPTTGGTLHLEGQSLSQPGVGRFFVCVLNNQTSSEFRQNLLKSGSDVSQTPLAM